MSQMDLFSEATAASTGVAGLEIILPQRCQCGTSTAVIGSSRGPHHASIRCSCCGIHRAWLSGETFRFVQTIIDTIGRPAEPIIVTTNSRKSADAPAVATALNRKGT
jgi:hypothetical protein